MSNKVTAAAIDTALLGIREVLPPGFDAWITIALKVDEVEGTYHYRVAFDCEDGSEFEAVMREKEWQEGDRS